MKAEVKTYIDEKRISLTEGQKMKTLNIVTILCLSLLCFSRFQFVNSDPNFDGRFSTKTSYFSVANENTEEIKIDGKV